MHILFEWTSILKTLPPQILALPHLAVPMDATASESQGIQYHDISDQPVTAIVASPIRTFQRQARHCFGDTVPGEFPLAASPSIVLHVLTSCNFTPQDLAKLEASRRGSLHYSCGCELRC